MAKPLIPAPALLFVSFLYRKDEISKQKLLEFLPIGPKIEFHFPISPMAKYYSKEMGDIDGLGRLGFLMLEPVKRDTVIDLKCKSFAQEQDNSENGARLVNIDIGQLSLENFQLLTFKPFSHRIYLRDGVFAELTLQCEGGAFRTLPWTYPDYAHPKTISFFQWARGVLYNTLQ